MATYKTNADLFHLVKGLNGHEKAYYKKMARRNAGNAHSHHLDLFEMLDKSASYDDKLAQQHIGIDNQTQFSTLKSYLGKDILDTIVFLKRNDDTRVQLQFWLNQLEALLQKRLLQLARKVFKKAWECAVTYEQYDIQISLLQIQARMLEYRSYKEYKKQAADIARQLQETLDRQHRQQQIRFYSEQLNAMRKMSQLSFEDIHSAEIQTIKTALEQLRPASAQDTGSLGVTYHNAMALAEHMLFNFEACNMHCDAALALQQASPSSALAHPEYLLSTASITFYNLFAQQRANDVTQYLQHYKTLAARQLKSEYYSKQWEIVEFHTTLKIYHKTARYDAVARLVAERAAYIRNCALQVLPLAEAITVIGSICISHFVLGDWAKAADVMIEMKELNHEVKREDTLYFTTIFHLLILYEQKDWYRLATAIEAAYHALYAHKKLRRFEKDLMLFLKRLSAIRVQAYISDHIYPFLKKLDQYKNDPVKKLYFLTFNYYGWLESKAQGIPYRKYMERQILGDQPAES